MSSEEYEQIITEIIASSGTARSCMIQAIWEAREGRFEEVNRLIGEADESLNEAHNIQTDLLQKEVCGNHTAVTLLMVHAQDHLMTAITVKELATELIKEIQYRVQKEAKSVE